MARSRKKPPPEPLSPETALIPVESTGFRKKAHTALKRARTAYRKAEAEWTQFHEVDEPEFARWIRVRCAALFSRAHALEQEIQSHAQLMHELRYEQLMTGDAPNVCYERVMDRREHPEKYPDAEPLPGPDADDPFEEFEEFDELPGETDHAVSSVGAEGDTLCKRLYRQLCRRLHPDTGAEMTAEQEGLWHQTQEAYQRRDPAALELLLTHCETLDGTSSRENSLWSLLHVTRQIRHALKTLRKTIREARSHIAWDFSTWSEDTKRRTLKKVHIDLRQTIRNYEFDLKLFRSEIEAWKRPSWHRDTPAEQEAEEDDWAMR